MTKEESLIEAKKILTAKGLPVSDWHLHGIAKPLRTGNSYQVALRLAQWRNTKEVTELLTKIRS